MYDYGLFKKTSNWLLAGTLLSTLVGCAHIQGSPLIDSGLLPLATSVAQPGDVTVTFLGVSTLLFSDGETHLMVDGFFSRPSTKKVIFNRRVTPDVRLINQAMAELKINGKQLNTLDAVLVTHSHYDHAMDAGIVAGKMKAQLLGSESTRQIALGTQETVKNYPIADKHIHVVVPGDTNPFGEFKVTFYQSEHYDLPIRHDQLIGTSLTSALELPAKITGLRRRQQLLNPYQALSGQCTCSGQREFQTRCAG